MKRFAKRGTCFRMGLLVALAAAIGIYLIATTVLIAKDGQFYIDQARHLTGDLAGPPEVHLLGYPLLIAGCYWILSIFGFGGGLESWIVSAQAAALVAKVLCLLPLSAIGRRFVGSKRSIMAIFVLVLLPLPAEWGADVLRDFPSLCLLLTSLMLLIAGAESERLDLFALAGLACGIGFTVREELLQLALYAVLWLVWRLVTARGWSARGRHLAAGLLFVVMLAIPAGLHYSAMGERWPAKTDLLLQKLGLTKSAQQQAPDNPTTNASTDTPPPAAAGAANNDLSIPDATYKIVKKLGGNFHEYYYLFWAVGLVCCLRRKGGAAGKFFVLAMMVGTVALLYMRYFEYSGELSKRYLLPLSAGTIFFVPEGLRQVGIRIELLLRLRHPEFARALRRKIRISTVLLLVGVVLCVPKLLTPTRWDKQYYADAASWLAKNSPRDALVTSSDNRIVFHAERTGAHPDQPSDYIVRLVPANTPLQAEPNWELVFQIDSTRSRDAKRIIIYRAVRPQQ